MSEHNIVNELQVTDHLPASLHETWPFRHRLSTHMSLAVHVHDGTALLTWIASI